MTTAIEFHELTKRFRRPKDASGEVSLISGGMVNLAIGSEPEDVLWKADAVAEAACVPLSISQATGAEAM